jgi:2-methylisocitrate lyase-like PEP mutase family enzyme
MNQKEKAKSFAQLHVKGAPLLLYNAWDAGSAQSVLKAGAKAIATSSWSVAAAQGYQDGEAIPIELAATAAA